MNQYLARINVSCSRTQRSGADDARTLSVLSSFAELAEELSAGCFLFLFYSVLPAM